jgi:hypothetical protein
MALLQVTKAYRMTSTEALQIITRVMPIDLLIDVRTRLHRKKSHTERSSVKAIVQEAIQTWHWQTTSKGRTTFEYFNKERIASRWVKPAHYMTQFISGYGDSNNKLKTFRLSEVDTCQLVDKER